MGMIDDILDGKAQLLDVRGDDEFDSGHAAGAIHISINRVISGKLGELDSTKPIYAYCASGGRAGMAVKYLKRNGFQAENVGGLVDWTKAGGKMA